MKEFEKFRGTPITFEQINPEFAEEFQHWLYAHTNVSSQNTVAKLMQNLREFVRDAHENRYHNYTAYQSSSFGVSRIQTSKHFLELSDLQALFKQLGNYRKC